MGPKSSVQTIVMVVLQIVAFRHKVKSGVYTFKHTTLFERIYWNKKRNKLTFLRNFEIIIGTMYTKEKNEYKRFATQDLLRNQTHRLVTA